MKKKIFLLGALLISLFTLKVNALTVPDTAQGVVEDMNLGWNLGDSLDVVIPSAGHVTDIDTLETKWYNPLVTKDLIKAVKKAGFRAVRIPVTYYNHMDVPGSSTGVIDEAWFERIDEVVNWCLEEDLYVVLDIHHDTSNDTKYSWIYADKTTYSQDLANFKNLWSQIGNHFNKYDNRVLFEATNEIMNRDSNWDWGKSWDDFRVVHDLDQEFINLIRGMGGNNSNRYLVLPTWAACPDSCQIENLNYTKFNDTVSNHLIMGVHNYGSSATTATNVVNSVHTLADKYGMPVLFTEITATTDAVAEAYMNAGCKYGITMFYWDDGNGNQLISRETYEVTKQDLVSSLVNTASTCAPIRPTTTTTTKAEVTTSSTDVLTTSTEEVSNPKTGVKKYSLIVLLFVVLLGIAILTKIRDKNKFNKI